jgi:hypothetical protein
MVFRKAGSALGLRLAAAMSLSDNTNETSEAVRRQRRKSNSLLLALAVGFLVFSAAAGGLYYALRRRFGHMMQTRFAEIVFRGRNRNSGDA